MEMLVKNHLSGKSINESKQTKMTYNSIKKQSMSDFMKKLFLRIFVFCFLEDKARN